MNDNPDTAYYGWTIGETLRPIINQTYRNMRKQAKRYEYECDIIRCWNCGRSMERKDGIPAHWRKKPQKVCSECFDRLWNKGDRYVGRDSCE